MAEMMELSGWEFKTTMLNMLRVLMDEVGSVQEQMTNVNRWWLQEWVRKKHPEVRHTVTEMMIAISALTTWKPLTVWITTNCGKFLEMGTPNHLPCLLRNPYATQEATVRTLRGKTDWFKIGKAVWQGCLLSSCLFKLYVEYIRQNSGLDESQAGIKIARRNINKLRYSDDTTPWQKVKRN